MTGPVSVALGRSGENAELRAELDRRAREGDATAWGFATAEPFEATRVLLEERKAAGLSADMQFTYRNPARSTEPDRLVPGAQSIITVALSYASEPLPRPREGYPLEVARYATDDFYGRLRSLLDSLSEPIRDAGFVARIAVDDNSLVDRAAAARAGLGWFGKNANVLLGDGGSWCVLGSIVTDAKLVERSPEAYPDGCGTCRVCIDQCPTGAIVGDGVVDASRCIAWLLQARGPIPLEFREAIGRRLYGCDTCQDVCPPNRLQRRRQAPPPSGGEPGSWVDAMFVLEAEDDALMESLGRFYIAGRDPRLWRRNVLIGLGNAEALPSERALALLHAAADGDDELLAEHAQWSLTRLAERFGADRVARLEVDGRDRPE